MSTFFCEQCSKQTEFLPVFKAVKTAGVSRSTIYYWMDRSWIHWRHLPSSRRVICVESLSRPVHQDGLHSVIKPAVA
jgi:hypothetical protein